MSGRFRAEHLAHFERHGWVLIPQFLSKEEVDGAQPALRVLYPAAEEVAQGTTPRARAFRDAAYDGSGGEPAFREKQFAGLREFPFEHQPLNLLAVHPELISLAEACLHASDIRLYQAETFAKYGGAADYEQPYHVDYTNHVMLPPDPRYPQIQLFVYLSEVTRDRGPTRVLSREITRALPLIDLHFHSQRRPALDDAEGTDAVGPAGSVLVYSANVAHRGTNMREPDAARFFFNLAYRVAGADWVGSNPWPRRGQERGWTAFVESCSERQLQVLGFPPPGHDYWTEVTLAGTAARYPGLDLRPWRNAR